VSPIAGGEHCLDDVRISILRPVSGEVVEDAAPVFVPVTHARDLCHRCRQVVGCARAQMLLCQCCCCCAYASQQLAGCSTQCDVVVSDGFVQEIQFSALLSNGDPLPGDGGRGEWQGGTGTKRKHARA
jgi:hypothetical protein